MKKIQIPEGYQQIMPYLIVENAAAFSDFAKKVFDAEEKLKVMRTETLIMHAEIIIGGGVIMFADATEQYAVRNAGMFIYVDDCDTIYQKALDHGATSAMEPSDQNYGRAAGVTDPFGNTWWLASI
jgi:PhnB protein